MLLSRISVTRKISPITLGVLRRNIHATNVYQAIKPFLLADIGEGIAEVELMSWYVKQGDKVRAFDKLCEVQSDKATVEITSRFDGVIAKVNYKEGDIVKVGSALVDIETTDKVVDTKTSQVSTPSTPPPTQSTPVKSTAPSTQSNTTSSKPFILADIGEGIAEVELMTWYVKVGDTVKAFDKICEVQSDKATVEITSRYDGLVTAVHHNVGDIVKVGSALVDIQPAGQPISSDSSHKSSQPSIKAAPSATPASPSPSPASSQKSHGGPVLTTPAVRKIAKENSIDLQTIQGTGPKGRILKEDVLNYIKNGGQSPSPPAVSASSSVPPAAATSSPASSSASSPTTSRTGSGVKTVVPIRGVQRIMVKSMSAALQIPHLGYSEEIVMDSLIGLRKQLKNALENKKGSAQIKLSYMPFILKASSLALLEYPVINSTVNAECTEITLHGDHNIGVAMDTPKGLIVPVLKEVQNMSIVDIAKELSHLQDLATKGSLTEAHLSGGTFSLSNIGSIGGTYTSPIIVVPQVAIGAIGRFQIVPRYVGKNGVQATSDEIYSGKATVAPTTIMNVSWSADHRVIDGATIARFSNSWKSYLETPTLMLGSLR